MPFVVANYSPEDSGTESKGLERKERFIKVNSKTPIQTYVDQDCLRYLNLLDDDDPEKSYYSETHDQLKNDSVS